MITAFRIPPAPVGQQAPPARAAASDPGRSLRVARGSLLLTKGTGYRELWSKVGDGVDQEGGISWG